MKEDTNAESNSWNLPALSHLLDDADPVCKYNEDHRLCEVNEEPIR